MDIGGMSEECEGEGRKRVILDGYGMNVKAKLEERCYKDLKWLRWGELGKMEVGWMLDKCKGEAGHKVMMEEKWENCGCEAVKEV